LHKPLLSHIDSGTLALLPRDRERKRHDIIDGARHSRWRMLLGHAGFDPQNAWGAFNARWL
jgi:hypothetical protein